MTLQNQPSSVLRGFAKALPPRLIANSDLSKWMETSDEWISKRTGIQQRYWVDEHTKNSTLAVTAAKKSLDIVGTQKVDAIVAATLSPDYFFPGIGVQIQAALGLPAAPAYDIRNQCSGFLYGIEMADALIRGGVYQRVLLVGSEVHSTGLDISTRGRDVAVLFGDGAGCCVMERSDLGASEGALRLLGTELHSDGADLKELWCEHPGSAPFPARLTEEMIRDAEIFPFMNGRKVFERAVKAMVEVSQSLLKRLGLEASDVKLLVPHQANIRINESVREHLGLKPEQAFNTIHKYGNTTAATIPIGLTDAFAEGRIQSGDIVLSAAFGSGYTWGAAAMQAL